MTGPDMGARYLGLELRSPLVASASPLTGHLDGLRALEDAGVGAVVLPSLFEEELVHHSLELDRMLATVSDTVGEASSFFPDLPDYDTGPDRHLALLTDAKASLDIPVVASVNGTSRGGWLHHAQLFAEAGADAIELNVYRVAADPDIAGSSIEDETIDLVDAVCDAVDVPVAVKLSPYWSSVANLATRLDARGASGLVLFNRFFQPDLDLESLTATPHLVLSGPDELRLPLRWVGLLRGRVGCSLAITSGVHDWEGLAKSILVGADVAMSTSALLRHGPDRARAMLDGLERWMVDHDVESVGQVTGSAAALTGPDPAGFERANYVRTLASWS